MSGLPHSVFLAINYGKLRGVVFPIYDLKKSRKLLTGGHRLKSIIRLSRLSIGSLEGSLEGLLEGLGAASEPPPPPPLGRRGGAAASFSLP